MSNLPLTFTDVLVALNSLFFSEPEDIIGNIELEETEEDGELEYIIEEEDYDIC